MNLEWTFGDRLRKARRELGLSQAEIAECCGVQQGAIANWESGHSRCRDEVSVAKAIEASHGVPATWLLGLDAASDSAVEDSVTHRYLNPPKEEDPTGGTIEHPSDTFAHTPVLAVVSGSNLFQSQPLAHNQDVRGKRLSEVVALWCAARNFSPNTTRQRTILVGKFIAVAQDCAVEDVDINMVLQWWAAQSGLAPETRKASRAAVKGFLDFLVACGVLESNPAEVIATPRVPRTLPKILHPSEVDRLRESLTVLTDRIAVEAMLGAGLRVVEVSRLRAEDFRDDGTFVVTGKGSHVDVLPIPERLAELVDGCEGRLVPMLPNTLSQRMRKVLRDAGLGHHSAHSLRRTFATNMADLNNIAVVQAALRHASLATTQHYVRPVEVTQWRLPA